MNTETTEPESVFLPAGELQSLITLLTQDGFQVVGPTIDQGAIVYSEITSVDQLPRGWTDRQEAATYRLEQRDDEALFGYVVGPHSRKKYLFPPLTTVSSATKTESGWEMRTPEPDQTKYAFLGVRACELAAIGIQDQVFTGGPYVDPVYHSRRKNAFLIAVNCTQAASTCFCASMNTGPRCASGFDLAQVSNTSANAPKTATPTPVRVVEQPVVQPKPESVADAFANFTLQPTTGVPVDNGGVDIRTIKPPREVAEEPEAKPEPPKHPKRYWVQVATGRDRSALRFDWRRISRKASDELGDKSGFVTPWGQSNRLLAGPYDSLRAAQRAVTALKEDGVDSFTFTSPEGQEIDPI